MSDHGRFIWCELMTPDVAAAKAFYVQLLGWSLEEMTGGDMTYTLAGPGPAIAGMMELPDDLKAAGVPPNWTGYVDVDDVDAAAEKAKQLGGSVQVPPTDIPDIGRFAVIADPGGAVISIMTPAPMEGGAPMPTPGSPGTAGWRELYAADLESAFSFYSALFGWRKDDDVDMGPMGVYRLFANQDGQVGGMMTKPADFPVPAWLYYFVVDDIDAGATRVKAGGGQVLNGPMEVPGGDWIVQAADPQGAMFALMGKKTA
ncbi:VOC family protein [Phenylobacterium sp.]|uniref:VOC family protein n=1 Tax=Phenylobacterium sp. TaxID=1871053 RepID=UPI002FDF72DD